MHQIPPMSDITCGYSLMCVYVYVCVCVCVCACVYIPYEVCVSQCVYAVYVCMHVCTSVYCEHGSTHSISRAHSDTSTPYKSPHAAQPQHRLQVLGHNTIH